MFPDSGDSLYKLALIDLEAGDLDACASRVEAALKRFQRPQDIAKSHALLGDVHRARGESHEARAAYETCVRTFPHYEVFYKLARVCALLGDEAAAQRYRQEHLRWRERAGR